MPAGRWPPGTRSWWSPSAPTAPSGSRGTTSCTERPCRRGWRTRPAPGTHSPRAGWPDPAEAGRAVAARYPVVVGALGPEGAFWISGDDVVHRAALAPRVVDTTGAGEAFAAGLLAAWLAAPDGPPAGLLGACLTR